MKCLVTGGAGFIGSALARALLESGSAVFIVDNFLTGRSENVPAGAELIHADLRDLDALRRACRGVEVVFHQAALRSVPRSVDEPILAQECNVEGTLNLLIAAADAGVRRVIYASSSSVYGDTARRNRESAPTNPRSPYAVSKLAGEHYCRVWTLIRGLQTVSLRYFNVFGPGQRPDSRYAAVFPAFVSALAEGRRPEIHWDGEQARDFTYIDDVVQANLAAARAAESAAGQVFNVAGGRPRTVNQVLSAVSEAMGIWLEPHYLPRRPGDIRRTHADVSRTEKVLGWRPEVSWQEAVERTTAWFLEERLAAGRDEAAVGA
jgi:nucleoside-diphosphate-sugar epimerase